MIVNIFAIKDSASRAFNQPFSMHTFGQAIRAFQASVNDESSQINKNPEDFSLYHIAEYDDNTGVITPVDITLVARATELLESDKIVITAEDYRKMEKTIAKLQEQLTQYFGADNVRSISHKKD